mmetsp:Transcript_5231/g.12145  ORF Transcript_5231/g.12145 Transcript_5231/m.12145 type:complete len:286 (+) Transcript_5231:713-1570(+)
MIDRLKDPEREGRLFGKMMYAGDTCVAETEEVLEYSKNQLFAEWLRFWPEPNSTFLVQKTPLLDVQLLERLKVMPSLHVIVVRHPMSYARMHAQAGAELHQPYNWLDSWNHVLTGLSGVEWYAVITYEALVLYHDQVVRELVEVVRSGVARYEGASHASAETIRRKLHLHRTKDDPAAYLDLGKTIRLNWKRCCDDKKCLRTLQSLTEGVLPHFGYVNEGVGTLSSRPKTVVVSKDYGRVLFSSEGSALKRLRGAEGEAPDASAGSRPSQALLRKMRNILSNYDE